MPRPTRLAPLALTALAALACDDEQTPSTWSDDLIPCDAREADCARTLARGLAAVHGVPWPDDVRIDITVIEDIEYAPLPAPWWSAHFQALPTPFDGLDDPPAGLPRPVGAVRRFGRAAYEFRIYDDVRGDDALRHRLGFIRGMSRHLRAQITPGAAVDRYSPWPTVRASRYAFQEAIAQLVELAIQRAAAGEDPWAFSPAERNLTRGVLEDTQSTEARALDLLLDAHDPGAPRATLVDLLGEFGAACLPAIESGDPGGCHIARADAPRPIDGFYARSADAADSAIAREALIPGGHPGAGYAAALSAHLGRDWHRADGIGVRQDLFAFATPGDAEGFFTALARATEADGWEADGPGRWLGDDGPLTDRALELRIERDRVTRISGPADLDLGPFFDDARGVSVSRFVEPAPLPDIECASAAAPCDARAACCRQALVRETESLLRGRIGPLDMQAYDPETSVDMYLGPRWALDRFGERITALVRFATGVDHTLRADTDAATEEQARRVLAWYQPDLRQVVMIVGDDRDLEQEARTVVHELAHAWQDEHFGIGARRLVARAQSSDAEAALVAVVEGHAQLVMSAFSARQQSIEPEDADWDGFADTLTAEIAPGLDDMDEPAREGDPWLPYVGGQAHAARNAALAIARRDPAPLTAAAEPIAAPPPSTAALLGEIYDRGAATRLPSSLPTGAADPPAGLRLAHRAPVGAWALALRLTGSIGAEDAFDRTLPLTMAHEAVLLTTDDAPILWFEARTAGDLDRLYDALDAWGADLAERADHVYALALAPDRITLAVAPDEGLIEAVMATVEVR